MTPDDDPLRPMRGIANGLVFGLVAWAIILAALLELVRWAR